MPTFEEVARIGFLHSHHDYGEKFSDWPLTEADKAAGWIETELYGPDALAAAERKGMERAAEIVRGYETRAEDKFNDVTSRASSGERNLDLAGATAVGMSYAYTLAANAIEAAIRADMETMGEEG